MKSTNVGRSIVITFVAQLALYGQGLIVMPIAIKLAGEAVYGRYILILAMMNAAFGLSSLGAGYNFRRRLASTNDAEERRRLFEPQFSFQALNLAIISGLLLIGGSWLQQSLFGLHDALNIWILPAWFAVYLAYSQVCDYFRYTMRFVHFNLVAQYPTIFILFVAAYAFITHSISLNVLLLLQIAAYAIVTAPLLCIMLRETGYFRFRLPWKSLRQDISIGYPLTLQFITDLLMGYADRYLILAYLTVVDVGRYQPAYQLAALAIFFPKVAGVVLPPALSRMVDSNAIDAAKNLTRNFLRLFLMMAIPFVAGVTMLGPTLIAFLANHDVATDSRWVGPLIALATIFNGIGVIAFQVAFVLGRTKSVLNANLVGTTSNILLNFVLLYFYRDITVAALASLISYVACYVYIGWALKGSWPISIPIRVSLQFVLAAAAMTAVLFLLGYRPGAIMTTSIAALLLHVALGAMVYFISLALVGGFHRGDIEQFRAIFRRELRTPPDGASERVLP